MNQDRFSPEYLEREEKELVFIHFSREDAFRLGALLHSLKPQAAIEIFVNGLSVFKCLPEGIGTNIDTWLTRKHNMVRAMEMSTMRAKAIRDARGITQEFQLLDPTVYARAGGGFPVRLKESGIIGAVCVSGLTSGLEEHEYVTGGIREFLGKSETDSEGMQGAEYMDYSL